MPRLRVLIVGASIAGPTAAYWFAKAGAIVTVIERFPHLRTNGQNVDIRTSGVTVMRRIPGMEATVRAACMSIEGMCLVRSDGRPYGVIRSSGNAQQQTLISEYEILRGRLSKILHDLTKDHKRVKYIYNEQVAAIQQHMKGDRPVTVEFVNGLPTAEYDLVVACDGVTSRTRALGLECGVRDYVQPTGTWAAYSSIKKDLLNGCNVAQGYGSIPGRLMTIKPDPDPNYGNMVTMMTVNSKDSATLKGVREAIKQGNQSLKKFIADYYGGAGWRTEEVLEAMMECDNLYASEGLIVKVPTLFNGRFVLVGDAGYAPGITGTGTTLALTGAYVLAGEICKHKGNIQAGLEGYESTMRPLIIKMTKQPPFVTSIMAPQTSWGLWVRNHLFALIAWSKLPQFLQWIFGSASGDINKFPLPDYDWDE